MCRIRGIDQIDATEIPVIFDFESEHAFALALSRLEHLQRASITLQAKRSRESLRTNAASPSLAFRQLI